MVSRLYLYGACLVLAGCGARGSLSDSPNPTNQEAILDVPTEGEQNVPPSRARTAKTAAEAQGFVAQPDDTLIDSANAAAPSEQPEWSIKKSGAELVDESGSCLVYIDVAESPLVPSDISVVSGDETLAFDDSCSHGGFRLSVLENGLYVSLCGEACELFKKEPRRVLEVRSNYTLGQNRPQPK